ncbi:MAG: 50S ribosomal protein L18 [Candidatus Aenigmarchaeota archaeon]|nr:50S ribosomal protein L18 [Candidatus Aenigmarchaeota archaeon]
MMKRRREQKTDYAQRLALLKGGKNRIVVRKSNNRMLIQIVEFAADGDKTLASANSLELAKLGWKGHSGNMPSAYLTGLLMGRKALQKGIKSAVVDIGTQYSHASGVLYAAVKGAKDAGMEIPVSAAPDEERIKGAHIARYAAELKKSGKARYERQFSAMLKKGIAPEDVPKNFEEVKTSIMRSQA